MIAAVLGSWSRRRDQAGSASVELIMLAPLLVLAALAGWQMLLFAFSSTAAENAARTGSRVEGRGGQGERAALESMSPWLRNGADVRFEGTKGTVTIRVPIVVPTLRSGALTVSESAELPATED